MTTQFTNAQVSQTAPTEVGHLACPSLSHKGVGHPLTCANVQISQVSQMKTWDTSRQVFHYASDLRICTVPPCPLLRREALKPAPAPPYATPRAHKTTTRKAHR